MGISKASPFLSLQWFLLLNSLPVVFSLLFTNAFIAIEFEKQNPLSKCLSGIPWAFFRSPGSLRQRKEMIPPKSSLVCPLFYWENVQEQRWGGTYMNMGDWRGRISEKPTPTWLPTSLSCSTWCMNCIQASVPESLLFPGVASC